MTLESPSGSADVVVTVAANAAIDGVNTGPASELSATATWDTGAPTITIGGVPATINSRTVLSVTFAFSKSVTGFITDDVMVTGSSKGAFTGSGSNYTLAVTPSGTADVVVTVAANSATDGINTGPASEVSATATWDATAPAVVITDVPAKISSVAEFTAKFIFTEDVTGFKTDDVAVTGGRKGTFSATNATTYSLKVTPTSGSNVTLTVAADAATDGLNTGPTSPVSATATRDVAAPTVTISDVPAKINSTTALNVTFTFSEDVTGFETEDGTVSGGQKGTFTATNASAYTLSVTPTDGSNVTITVAADAATDGLNTGPASTVSATATWYATVPTVTIADVPLEINSTAPFTAKFTFSEDVTGFDTDDVTVFGGRKGSFNATNATTYSLVVTPTRGSNVTLTVAANAATDGLNTGPASEVSATATWNAAALTVAIGGLPARINSRTALNITFTFSSAVTGFVTGDVTVAGGRKGTFSGSGRNYTLAVTPSGSAAVVVFLAANSATDGTIMGPASPVSATATWDATAPTVTISDVPAKINSTTALNVTFTFSEDVTGFETGDVTVSGGRKGTFTATNATTYTLTVTPTSGSNVTLTVAPNAATDGLNTGPAAAVTATATWDATVPTVTISDVPATINSTAQFTAAFTFSEAVTGFVTDDVSVAGGTKGTFSGSGTTYTLLITPNGSANVVVTVAAGAATDGVNTGPASAVSATALWDFGILSVAITGVPAKINSTDQFTAEFTFSEAVTEFDSDDVAVTGGTKGTFSGTGSSYTLLVTPDGSADVAVTVAADVATSGEITGPTSEVSATATWDAIAPTLAISDVPARINSTMAFTATFTFSEGVTGFVADDVMVTGGTKGAFSGSGNAYTLLVTPIGSMDVVVTVAANAATDGLNTGPESTVSASADWGVEALMVTIIGVPAKINSTAQFTATFTFSEDVMEFVTDDVMVTGGTKGTFAGSGTTYTLPVTPDGSADVVVTVAANTATDGLNTGPASEVSVTATWDATIPTVTISDVPATITPTAPFTATFAFSEDVIRFNTDDVMVSGGTKGTFSGSGTTYTLEVTPDGSMDVVVTVAANAATDGLNTGPASAVSATAVWDGTGVTIGNEEPPFPITLWGNSPNPVIGHTNIVFNMPERAQVSIRVTDLLGRIVQMNHFGWYEASRDCTVEIGIDNLTAGVYFYTLRAEIGDQVIQRSKAMSVVR
ncbi:MAG: Ig-like domain-containing protein [Bacteroidota bacterium]|nr:Ig-like domain-containing protein [Bacteroidota bacterium]